MTWKDFETELKNIAGVSVIHEKGDSYNFMSVSVGGLKIDYFLIKYENNIDKYMAIHYITIIRLLATFMQ